MANNDVEGGTGINYKALLIRNGWRVEECKENVLMRETIYKLHDEMEECKQKYEEDRADLDANYSFLTRQHSHLQRKIAMSEEQLQKRQVRHQKATETVKKTQKEKEQWRKRYEEEQEKHKELLKQIDFLNNPTSQPPGEVRRFRTSVSPGAKDDGKTMESRVDKQMSKNR